MSEVFKALGYDVPHERRGGRDGISQWHYVGKQTNCNKFQKRVHIVREYWKVIRSVAYTFAKTSMKYISRNTSIKDNEVNMHNSMLYWYEWNKLAEKRTDIRVRVEDEVNLPALWQFLGLEYKPDVIASVPTNTNTRDGIYKTVTKDEILQMMVDTDKELYDNIRKLAVEYGYEL